jgi:phage terminase large subunit-like protein
VNGPACIKRGRVPHWAAIIAPTLGDAVQSCVTGPSGILTHDPGARLVATTGGSVVRWENGAEAKLFGASSPDDVERLRAGGNRCVVWCEELAAWRQLDNSWDHMTFGLRLGDRPHWVGSTTPKPRPLIKKLVRGEIPGVVVTNATTYDNPHLVASWRDRVVSTYANTTLGDQELLGKIIEQDSAALWNRVALARNRITKDAIPDLTKITVGVDPSGGAGEQGIVVDGAWVRTEVVNDKPTRVKDGYTLADYSTKLSPAGWAKRAVLAAVDWDADDIVVETNFGGDMALATITGEVERQGLSIPVRKVTASRGKRARGEPVAALSDNDRWHLVGHMEALEDQLCTWTDDAGYSPDRLDAMVWGGWHLKLASILRQSGVGSYGGSAMSNTVMG